MGEGAVRADPEAPLTGPRRRRARRSRLAFLLAVLAALVVFPALGLEVWLRLARDPLDLWHLTGRVVGANPMRRWAQVDAFGAYRGRPGSTGLAKSINSHGFVSTPELDLEKAEGTLRLLFLGGSSTAGMGFDLADEDTWPWLAAEGLAARVGEQRIEFINAALGGYSTFESYGRLWSRLRAYEPDIVVVCHGWNDMYYFDLSGPERLLGWRTLPDGDWTLDRSRGAVSILQPRWIDHLLRHSQLLIRARLRLAAWVDTFGGEVGGAEPLADTFDATGLEVYRTNLRLMRQTARVLGAELFVVKQPTLIVPGLSAELRARCRYEYHGFDHDAHVAAFAGIYRVIDEEIEPERVIDLTVLSGQPGLFHDHVHPTVQGAATMAAMVADRLLSYLRAREEAEARPIPAGPDGF